MPAPKMRRRPSGKRASNATCTFWPHVPTSGHSRTRVPMRVPSADALPWPTGRSSTALTSTRPRTSLVIIWNCRGVSWTGPRGVTSAKLSIAVPGAARTRS